LLTNIWRLGTHTTLIQMKYLKKFQESPIISNQWIYPKDSKQIRKKLLSEQRGFCAYSERYIERTDACEVEHFDPRLKNTAQDSYWNWYAVIRWMNSHKTRKISSFEPILSPYSEDIVQRIKYKDGRFHAVNTNDHEARNLIDFLGWNLPELCTDRTNHIKRLKFVRKQFDQESFHQYLLAHPVNLSFFTALVDEFGLPENLIDMIPLQEDV
jgi:hypothetical protein